MKKIIPSICILLVAIGAGYFIIKKNSFVGENPVVEVSPSDQVQDDTLTLDTEYISTVDCPPVIQVVGQPFGCTEAGEEIARAGKTQKETIDGVEYCVTKVSEGAAGSVYTQYAYARAFGDKTQIATFSLRFVQCYNYDDPKQSECLAERKDFSVSSLIPNLFK